MVQNECRLKLYRPCGEEQGQTPVHLEPAATGTIFRLVEFPPDAVWKTDGADGKEAFSELQAEHASSEGDDPAMHKTASVDYALVLEGEISAVMETDERLKTAGNVLVQRGTESRPEALAPSA